MVTMKTFIFHETGASIMVTMKTLLTLVMHWFMVLGNNLSTSLKLSLEEDKNLEIQLTNLNKPIVTTIEVNIYVNNIIILWF